MATVNTQDNPVIPLIGSLDSNAVIISSEQTSSTTLVSYQIEDITIGDVITIDSAMNGLAGGNIVSVDKTTLKIILDFRTRYRVRTKTQFGAWSVWVNFTTRDKRYQSPEAITSLIDDTDSSSQTQGTKINSSGIRIAQGGSRTIVVTNNAKAIETDNAPAAYNTARNWGAVTITNADTIFNDGQLQTASQAQASGSGVRVPVIFTAAGATVINVPSGKNDRISFTNAGATIDTRG